MGDWTCGCSEPRVLDSRNRGQEKGKAKGMDTTGSTVREHYMIELGLNRSSTEKRGTYTDMVIDAISMNAQGAAVNAGKTAAMETIAGFLSRCFAAASVEVAEPFKNALGASTRANIGRRVITAGEYVAMLEVDPPSLREAHDYDYTGRYRLTFAAPTKSIVIMDVDPAKVIHIKYSDDRFEPWRGIAPLTWARDGARLAGSLEESLADEASTPHGQLLPLGAAAGTRDEAKKVKESFTSKLSRLKGGLMAQAVRDMPGGQQGKPEVHAIQKWATSRVGASPPVELITLHRQAYQGVLAACGISAALFSSDAAPASQREALRTCLHTVVEPIARLVEEELSIKMETPVVFDFRRLAGIDHQGRARAVKALVDAGVPLEDALERGGVVNHDSNAVSGAMDAEAERRSTRNRSTPFQAVARSRTVCDECKRYGSRRSGRRLR